MEKNARCTKLIGVKKCLQLADIGTKNVSEPDITPRMKYIMVRLETGTERLCKRVDRVQASLSNNSSE